MTSKSMARSMTNAVYIASTTVSASGLVSATMFVPADMNLGDYVLQINGETDAVQIRSVNLLMNVIAAPPAMQGGVVQRAGFYEGRSDEISASGQRKLRQLVRSIPKNAQAVQVLVTGVSVGMDSLRSNAVLAADRAATLAAELEKRGVTGEFVVTVTTSFTVDGTDRSLAQKGEVLTTKSGKPLSTVTILFQEPV
jgi:outer membrane protein OmpA-like peptidoglycan-associated protein